MNLKRITVATLLLNLLAACGGGGGGADSTDSNSADDGRRVPASALVSASAFSSYTGSLARTETGDGLWVNEMVAPTSESEAPLQFN